jgi:murein DD-endopeptidase MepM/ murein hydrolase activator NlpD
VLSRRLLLATGSAFAAMPRLAGAQNTRVNFSGNLEQGSLVVGRTEAAARVTIDGNAVQVSPQGVFAFGLGYNQDKASEIAVRFADGSEEKRTVMPVVRQYDIQRIDGLPQQMVTPTAPDIIERINRESASIVEARKRATDATWFADGFDWPAKGILSGTFGSQRILNGVAGAVHYGVDVTLPETGAIEGKPITAPAPALVVMVAQHYLNGGFTLLDHGQGVSTCYLHQSAQLVKEGDKVERGQLIGHIGHTGRATGPHLHWAMNWFQVRLDPSRWTRTAEPPKT